LDEGWNVKLTLDGVIGDKPRGVSDLSAGDFNPALERKEFGFRDSGPYWGGIQDLGEEGALQD
jgi:hypothetical protein